MQLPPNHRRAVIQGLRELADALALTHDLPIPLVVEVAYHPRGDSDAEKRTEVDRISDILGAKPEYSADGEHYSVTARFGAVHYSAVTVSERAMARHYAHMSYSNNFDHITQQETDE